MSNSSRDMAERWDPCRFRLDPSLEVAPLNTRTGRRISPVRGKFLAGPVDMVWLSNARMLGVTALYVGLCLWFLKGLKKSDVFVVSNLHLHELGVLPDAESRALRQLERAGLITIDRRGKRSPRVTLVLGAVNNVADAKPFLG